MSHRKERFASTLKQSLADILMVEMNNPLFKSVFIADVLVTPDLKKARVFVSLTPVPGGGDKDVLAAQLAKAKGFIKRSLARRMYLRYIPELEFIIDRPLAVDEADAAVTAPGD